MEKQPVESQKGEIEFRRKLAGQQVAGEKHFDDELDAAGIISILAERMRKAAADFSALKSGGTLISPYLEIGAERCQSSLAMENDLGCTGIAADISFDMLRTCRHYMGVFGKNKEPLRVCCDANHLPFLSGSFPFVFCHQTLHHFPDPAPVTAEILRVLSPGGHFYLADEPFRQTMHLNLYKGPMIYSGAQPRRGRLRERLDFLFSEKSCNETGCGVIENEAISAGQWRRALSGFEERRVTLRTVRDVESELFSPSSLARYFFCWLFGGRISGVCRKAGAPPAAYPAPGQALACPECLAKGKESRVCAGEGAFACASCGSPFPVKDGVLFLFTAQKLMELYPEFSGPRRRTGPSAQDMDENNA